MKRITVVGLAVVLLASGVVFARQANVVGPVSQMQPGRWQAERAGMLTLLLERVRSHVVRVRAMVEIGTMAPIDARSAEQLLADLEKRIEADASAGTTRRGQTLPEIAAVRIRFAEAMNAIDAAEVRLDNGMMTIGAANASFTAAAAVLLGPGPGK